jgi:hypothetical protein
MPKKKRSAKRSGLLNRLHDHLKTDLVGFRWIERL